MKSFYIKASIAVMCLLGLNACSTDDTDGVAGGTPVPQPQIAVQNVSNTGFTLRWEAVEAAGSYIYSFNNGEQITTTKCEIVFDRLNSLTEYVVAIKASPKDPSHYSESAYAYVHVLTDDINQLKRPDITLGCAYASKTIISWTPVADAASYEYVFNGKTYSTEQTQIELNMLSKSTPYTFQVRAISGDEGRLTHSALSTLEFTTEATDMPTLIVSPQTVTSDSITFDIYATSDQTYFYDIIPATIFAKIPPDQILELYRTTLIEEAEKMGISFPLAMAAQLVSGNTTTQYQKLIPELSYIIMCFGMNIEGELTTGLYSTKFKTPIDGYTDGPNFGNVAWFKQKYYITSDLVMAGYDLTNSTHSSWTGQDVSSVRYKAFVTSRYKELFPDTESIRSFLESDYADVVADAFISSVNTPAGLINVFGASPGRAYTLATLASSTSGASVLCVNSVTTKTDNKVATWFQAFTNSSEGYEDPSISCLGVLKGKELATCRYGLFDENSIKDIDPSKYPQLIEEFGKDIAAENIPKINSDGGYGMVFTGLTPETTYVFMATAVNTVGDALTRSDKITTAKAKVPPTPGPTGHMAVGYTSMKTFTGKEIPNSEFIMPIKVVFTAPAPELTPWEVIHNMQILK